MSNGTEKIGGGKRMTFDGVPLRDGEEEVIFENHSLSWWRQFTVNEHKKNGTEPLYPSLLTAALYEDFTNHFGFPEHLRGKDMDPDGLQRLVFAIVKNITDDIVSCKIIEYNRQYTLHQGHKVSDKAMEAIVKAKEKAERDLHRKDIQMYLFGAEPDAVIREAYNVAHRTVDEFYEEQEKKISAHIRKSGITIKDLVAKLRKLDVDNDEIPDWITHCTPMREKIIRKIIKDWKEAEG